jgi:diaminohydroxyphosphoribosylaminopyrimidine deaminase/5-amino-6-(5-phosphoribosylamino)uracil reductase
MTAFSDFDRRAMKRALELAAKGLETTHPNPPVGCVIAKGDKIIAEGFHERAGGPHAEAAALQALASGLGLQEAEGATAYVTLEPCSHFGRTPPCSDALVKARVGRVVFAVPDPNPRVAGAGAAKLAQAGIQVDVGLMEAEAEEVNAGYLKRRRKGMPFVRVKAGMSLDGRTALANGKSKWITGEAAREDVQHWRARSSAVLTGIGTVLADDPQLNVRKPGVWRQPAVVVLDANARTLPTARLFSGGGQVVVFTRAAHGSGVSSLGPGDASSSSSVASLSAAVAALKLKGARVESVEGGDRLDPGAVLRKLGGDLEMNEVLVEAGPTLTGAFVREGLVDELLIYMAPKLLGPQGRPLFDLPLLEDLRRATSFSIIESAQLGPDIRLRLRP